MKAGIGLGLVCALGIAVALLAGAFAGAEPRRRGHGDVLVATGTAPRRVLVLTETRGYRHASILAAVSALRRIDAADRHIALTFLPVAASLTPARLHTASAVVFLLTSGELPLSTSGKQALLAFVRDGGGLVGFHSATDTFHHWPAYLALIGAEFSDHPHPSTQRVIVEDRTSPATRTLPPSFRIGEEFYVFTRDPRPRVRVLARLDTGPGGPDRPLVWCRRAGHGKVFYDALGHFDTTWRDRHQLALTAGGLDWAAGIVSGGDC